MKKNLLTLSLITSVLFGFGMFNFAQAKSHISINYSNYPSGVIYNHIPQGHMHRHRRPLPPHYVISPVIYSSFDYSNHYLLPRMRGGIGHIPYYNNGAYLNFGFSI